MKIIKKDYPWTVIIEDKLSQNTGKQYTSIGVGFTEKNRNATSDADKYKTTWCNTLDVRDLLKGASVFTDAYQEWKNQAKPHTPAQEQPAQAPEDPDDDFSF